MQKLSSYCLEEQTAAISKLMFNPQGQNRVSNKACTNLSEKPPHYQNTYFRTNKKVPSFENLINETRTNEDISRKAE
jgi:hypothetical protein